MARHQNGGGAIVHAVQFIAAKSPFINNNGIVLRQPAKKILVMNFDCIKRRGEITPVCLKAQQRYNVPTPGLKSAELLGTVNIGNVTILKVTAGTLRKREIMGTADMT